MRRWKCLALQFGPEWDALTKPQRLLVCGDFATLDATMVDVYGGESVPGGGRAAHEYQRRIGKGNLLSYARTLKAGRQPERDERVDTQRTDAWEAKD